MSETHSETETFQERLERQAREAVELHKRWLDADGWDNPEWEPFLDAMGELESTLDARPGATGATACPPDGEKQGDSH